MNCQQFEARIHQLLDERMRLIGDVQLSVHRHECSSCQRKFSFFMSLESYFTTRSCDSPAGSPAGMAKNHASVIPVKRHFPDGRRIFAFAAIAAGILATATPLLFWNLNDSHTSIAAIPSVVNLPAPVSEDVNDEVLLSQVLATIEELPHRLESLGPVYYCTAQVAGVSSLTSSLNLTVDLLRLQLSREVPQKDKEAGPHGRMWPAWSSIQSV